VPRDRDRCLGKYDCELGHQPIYTMEVISYTNIRLLVFMETIEFRFRSQTYIRRRCRGLRGYTQARPPEGSVMFLCCLHWKKEGRAMIGAEGRILQTTNSGSDSERHCSRREPAGTDVDQTRISGVLRATNGYRKDQRIDMEMGD